MHRADLAVGEVINQRIQPYVVLDGNICALLRTNHDLNISTYDPIAPDPGGLIAGVSKPRRRAAPT